MNETTETTKAVETLDRICNLARDLVEIVGTLAQEKSALLNRIADLEAIAPKKTILSNGQTMIWHCPDELIPEVQP